MTPSHSQETSPASSSSYPTTLPYDAVLFGMDGVVTRTASVHASAWKELFDSVLADSRAGVGADMPPFDADRDYRLYVDGRRREDGIRAFVTSRGIRIPPGHPEDGPDAWSVAGLAARKNDLFLAAVARDGVHVYPGTVALLERLRGGGVPVGLVTASRNAQALLEAAGLESAFDVIVDGQVAADQGVPGTPDPAMFLEAARRIGVAPERAVVIEDAVSGVKAGRIGGFGLVVGIDHDGYREHLEAAGADVVLGDVGQLDLGASHTDPWMLVYEGFDPAHEGHREALTALGNGLVRPGFNGG